MPSAKGLRVPSSLAPHVAAQPGSGANVEASTEAADKEVRSIDDLRAEIDIKVRHCVRGFEVVVDGFLLQWYGGWSLGDLQRGQLHSTGKLWGMGKCVELPSLELCPPCISLNFVPMPWSSRVVLVNARPSASIVKFMDGTEEIRDGSPSVWCLPLCCPAHTGISEQASSEAQEREGRQSYCPEADGGACAPEGKIPARDVEDKACIGF